MPERILRDLTDSDHYNTAPVHARDLFIRLMNKADDYGLYMADAKRLRPLLYPLLLEQVREADLSRWTAECAKSGLVRLYTVEGREYLQICRWGHQRLRNKKPKYPPPPWGYENPPDESAGHPQCIRSADAVHPPSDADTESDADTDTEKKSARSREPSGDPEGFTRFWSSWPPHFRKSNRKECLRRWKSGKLEPIADEILAGLARWKASSQWAEKDGQFIPLPLSWLNQEKWKVEGLTPVGSKPEPTDSGFIPAPVTDEIVRLIQGGTGD